MNRRGFFLGALAAPLIVRPGVLMAVQPLLEPVVWKPYGKGILHFQIDPVTGVWRAVGKPTWTPMPSDIATISVAA